MIDKEEKKIKIDENKELEKLVNDSLKPENDMIPFGQNEISDVCSEHKFKISVRPHPHNYKWDEESLLVVYQSMYDWFDAHPDAIFLEEYFHATDIEQLISYNTLRYTIGRFPSCDEAMTTIKEKLKIRLFKMGWDKNNKKDSTLTKFCLMNNFGWKENTNQDITVSTKDVKFKYANPELDQPKNEEDDE